MARIGIVTDSSANLPAEWIAQHSIHVVPIKIQWGEETLLDGVAIEATEFYERLVKEPTSPSTSQPSPEAFLQAFENLAPSYDGIIVPLISSGISGTVASAQMAAAQFRRVPVQVVDAHSASAGLALTVMAAARVVEQGCGLQEVAHATVSAVRGMHVYFVVDTLEYLHRGGRIGGAARFLGSALSIKPILFFDDDGKIDALERVRTRQNAVERLVTLAEQNSGGRTVYVGLIHANASDDVAQLRGRLLQCLDCRALHTFDLSPAIGAHVGPGAVSLAFHVD
jgi:DegV family protein with EDD domain